MAYSRCRSSASLLLLPAVAVALTPWAQKALALQPRAQKYEVSPTETFRTAPQCRDAIDRQRAQFKSHWQPQVTNHPRSHDAYNDVISHDGTNLAYVANQKVGSKSMKYAFGAFEGQSNKYKIQYSGAKTQATKATSGRKATKATDTYPFMSESDEWNFTRSIYKLKSKFLFTVVRDPLVCAWSSYTEVSHRVEKYGDDLALATPCNASDDRYLEYLNRLMDGTAASSQTFHSFPQVVKVDVLKTLNRDSFDFVVRIENFEEDMRRLFAKLDTPPDETTIQDFLFRFKWLGDNDVHPRDTQCDHDIDRTSSEYGLAAQTCKVACELYDVDFACFGYLRPPCCVD